MKKSNPEEPVSKEELDELIISIGRECDKIKRMDKIVHQMPESPAKKQYLEELLEMIDDYYIATGILEEMTKRYVKEEEERTGTTPLIYKKLLKALRQK